MLLPCERNIPLRGLDAKALYREYKLDEKCGVFISTFPRVLLIRVFVKVIAVPPTAIWVLVAKGE
jgi:hypothetical protein